MRSSYCSVGIKFLHKIFKLLSSMFNIQNWHWEWDRFYDVSVKRRHF